MKVLILSAETGKTANSAAEAIAEQLTKMNFENELLDSLIMVPESGDTLAHWSSSRINLNLSRRMGRSYLSEERHAARTLYHLCSLGADALHSVLEQGHYDAVLCVHVFSCMMMTAVRRKYGATPPFYFIATDYACAPGVSELDANGYFIPHRMLFADFIRCGFPADKLYATGIPVRPRFYAAHPDRMALRRELELPESGKIVLLRAGNLQHKHTARRALSLLRALPKDASLVVLCGKNEKLLHKLEAASRDRLFPRGFDVDPEKYLFASDLCIARPRAVFCAETLVCGIPLVLYRENRGVEAKSFDFLIRSGVSEGSWGWRDVIQATNLLLTNETSRNRLFEAVRSFLPANPAAEQICKIISRAKTSSAISGGQV